MQRIMTPPRETALGLGNEEELFQWRIDVHNFGHNLVAWEKYAMLHNSLPYGWDSLFGSSCHGIKALRQLSNMMSYFLIGEYLNPGCDAEPPPKLPPRLLFTTVLLGLLIN